MVTKEFAIKTASALVNDLKMNGAAVEKAFLFGSISREMQHEYSDIDIAIAGGSFTGVIPVDVKKYISVFSKDEYILIEPHTFSSKGFNEQDMFVKKIIETGIELKV